MMTMAIDTYEKVFWWTTTLNQHRKILLQAMTMESLMENRDGLALMTTNNVVMPKWSQRL